MLASPTTVTIDGVAHSLVKINQDNFGSTFLKKGAQLEIRLNVRHAYEKAGPNGQMERHNVDLQYTTWDDDGVATTTQVYTVLRPKRGDLVTLVGNISTGLNAWVNTNVAAITGWDS